jgi:hypothetical protein
VAIAVKLLGYAATGLPKMIKSCHGNTSRVSIHRSPVVAIAPVACACLVL